MNADVYEKDSVEKYWLIPIVVIVLYFLYEIRNKIKNTALMLDLKDKMDDAIKDAETKK